MNTPHFTDEQLEAYVRNRSRDFTDLESQLAQTIIEDRLAFKKLRPEIQSMASQILDPADNVFSRQLKVIGERL